MTNQSLATLSFFNFEVRSQFISYYLFLLPAIFFLNSHHGPLKGYFIGSVLLTLGVWKTGHLTQIPKIIWLSWLSLLYSFSVVFISYALSDDFRAQEVFRFFYKLSFLGGFIGVSYWVVSRFDVQPLLSVLKGCAAIGGILSLVIHTGQSFPDLSGRLSPFGLLYHPILGASVYGMVGLICFYHLFSEANSRRLVFINTSIFCLCSAVVFLTMSRGPLLSYSVSLLLIVSYFALIRSEYLPRQIYLVLWGLIGGVVGFVFLWSYLSSDYFALATLWQKRESYRLHIWLETWRYIQDVLPWGVGYKNQLAITLFDNVQVNHPHNLFLSKLYREGVVGILFLITILGLSLRKVSKIWRSNLGGLASILFVHGVFSCITDTSSLWDGKNLEMVLFFWFPLIFVAGIKENNFIDATN